MIHVLVLQRNLLLSSGIESLLSKDLGLIVETIALGENKNLIREIERYKPQVVVMDEKLAHSQFSILLDLLDGFPELCVMVADEKENQVHVIDKYVVSLGRAGDLVSAIRRITDTTRNTEAISE